MNEQSDVGYVQQLALSSNGKTPVRESLRAWTLKNFEGHDLQRIERPPDFCKTKGPPIAVLSVWEKLIEAQTIPNFVLFAEDNGLKREDVQGYIEGWERFRCGDIRHNIWTLENDVKTMTNDVVCHGREIWLPSVVREDSFGKKSLSLGLYNPYLSFYKTKSAVSRTLRKIETLDMETVYDITLTFPKEASEKVYNKAWPVERLAKECVQEFYTWLGEYLGGKVAVCANVHLWRSSDCKPHIHAHSLLLGDFVRLEEGQKLEEGRRMRLYPSFFFGRSRGRAIEGTLTNVIKRKWAFIVNQHFGTSYNQLDVHIEFIELKNKSGEENVFGRVRLLHKLKYNRRRPISDLALYYLYNSYDLSVQDKNSSRWWSMLINYENRPLTLGYWNRMSKLAVKEIPELQLRAARCPFCAQPLVYVGLHKKRELPARVLRVSIDRENRFYLNKEAVT